jgi:type I restriction enzyme S subunit
MIDGLKPYAASGVMKPMTRTSEMSIPWLTSIPAHWRIVRSKGLFSARTERARQDDEQLSATQAYGVIPQKDFESRVGRKVVRITQHLGKRAHVERDDFVISMRSFQGGLERAWAQGCIRSSYVVLKPSCEAQVGYFAHLFKSLDYIRALQATSNFIRDGQDLNLHNFSLVDLPLPPQDEQIAIAKCLDHANRKIDGFVRAKRKLIGLLNEQKQAIIHRAVTRGLDPDVPLKPSGIPWLGDIPAHWELPKVKQCARTISKGTTPSTEGRAILEAGPVRFLKAENISAGRITDKPFCFIDEETNRVIRRSQLAENDILFVIAGATLGKTAVVPSGVLPANTNQAVAFIRPNCRVVPRFLELWLQSARIKELIWLNAVQSAQPNLSMADLGNFVTPRPPRDEQQQILDFVKEATKPMSDAIARTEREIALMQEYRTRLTADIVTGKLDVREAAAKLPDLPAEAAAESSADDEMDDTETEELEA